MKIIHLEQIKQTLKTIAIIPAIEQAFIAYSNGSAIVPPVGELRFDNPPGDVHIKYGYIVNDDYYVIKVASGFYQNPIIHLPSSNGLMLLFSQKTGALAAILLDQGYLTDLRTAAAGAIAAKYLAPSNITNIGIIGTGIQARLQLCFLKKVTDCRNVIIWGRNQEKLLHFQNEMEQEGFSIQVTQDIEIVTSACNLIVTTTPSTTPLIHHIKKGTHITAVGADSPHKQELSASILSKADIIVADSIKQCIERGDIAHAIKDGVIHQDKVVELGSIISGVKQRRTSDEQITIADLTGLAVQDIAVAKAVFQANPV